MADVTEKLERLATLLEKGLITREQFEKQRDALMAEPALSGGRRPTSVGSYRIVDEIGQGGMGVVYRGRHRSETFAERQGGDVAIKVLHAQYARRDDIVARFEREAELGIRLNHPCIVRVHELTVDAGRVALIMELVGGRPLSEMIGNETGPIPWVRARPMFEQLLDAVGYAHAHGVIHRDLKPENVMVGPDGNLKILDFGIAKEMGSGRTQTGTGMGTIDYMAPEQYLDAKAVDARADIYALGMTLYEMLAGRLPWGSAEDETEFSILDRKKKGEVPLPTEFYPEIPPGVVDMVMGMLNPDSTKRLGGIDTIQKEVKTAATKPGSSTQTVPAVQPSSAQDSVDSSSVRPQPHSESAAVPDVGLARTTVVPQSSGKGGLWVVALALLAFLGAGAWGVSSLMNEVSERARDRDRDEDHGDDISEEMEREDGARLNWVENASAGERTRDDKEAVAAEVRVRKDDEAEGTRLLESVPGLLDEGQIKQLVANYNEATTVHGCAPGVRSRYESFQRRTVPEIKALGRTIEDDWFRERIETSYTHSTASQFTWDKGSYLLVFWEPWCPHCKRETPLLQAAYTDYRKNGVEIVALTRLTRNATEDKVRSFIAEHGLSYPSFKENGKIASHFNVSGIPAAVLLQDGVAIWRGHPNRMSAEKAGKLVSEGQAFIELQDLGSISLSPLPTDSACGFAADETGGGVPASTAVPEDESKARSLAAQITDHIKNGEMKQAKSVLEELQERYPTTSAYKSLQRRTAPELAVIGKKVNQYTIASNIETYFVSGSVDLDRGTTLVVFWEVWCPHCKREMPELVELYNARRGQGLKILGLTRLSKSSTVEKVEAFVAENDLNYPVAKENGKIAPIFNVSGIPAAAVVPNGEIIWRGHPNNISDALWNRWLDTK